MSKVKSCGKNEQNHWLWPKAGLNVDLMKPGEVLPMLSHSACCKVLDKFKERQVPSESKSTHCNSSNAFYPCVYGCVCVCVRVTHHDSKIPDFLHDFILKLFASRCLLALIWLLSLLRSCRFSLFYFPPAPFFFLLSNGEACIGFLDFCKLTFIKTFVDIV